MALLIGCLTVLLTGAAVVSDGLTPGDAERNRFDRFSSDRFAGKLESKPVAGDKLEAKGIETLDAKTRKHDKKRWRIEKPVSEREIYLVTYKERRKKTPLSNVVGKDSRTILLHFWASWCPPCKMVEPVMEELAAEWEGQLKVGKLNVDQNPKVSQTYQVLGVPTFTLFQSGEVLEHRVGAHSRDQLVRIINKVLGT